MARGIWGIVVVALSLALVRPAYPDANTYQGTFMAEVIAFANLNRLDLSRLHRDVHANCYIPVTVATVIRRDGSVKDAFIVKSSTVPVVDRYFLYVINQAAPYRPLANDYDPALEEITLTQEFKLDVQLWGHGVRSTRPCEELEPREVESEQTEGSN